MRQVIPKQNILDYYIPISPLTVKGGVSRVIDSATGDIAVTASNWIEDEKYGWRVFINNSASAEFDTAVVRTGTKSLKISTTGVNSYIEAYSSENSLTVPGISKYLIPIKPNTAYRFTCYMKTNYVSGDATNGVTMAIAQFTADNASGLTTTTASYIKTTTDWTKYTISFTSQATAAFLRLVPRLYGHQGTGTLIMDAWFDVNSMTLEEVTSITNSSSTPALLYPKLTAVTSTDNIDQSQVVSENNARVGDASIGPWIAQQFTPTKKKLTGFIVKRGPSTGTYTGDVTFSIQADSGSTTPSGTDLITSITIPNATWLAITEDTDYLINYPTTLTIGGTYWIVIKSSTNDASNYTRVRIQTTGTYAGGVAKNYNGSSWTSAIAADLYFKTLYSKNTTNLTVSTDTETVSVTAPTVDGWADGTVVSFPTPLTLASGANAIYVSSNGASTADGTVDSSLQGIMGGTYDNSAYPNPELNVRRTGYALLVENFRHIGLSLSTKDSANMTIKFQISNSRIMPDFAAARSVTNRWEYVNVKDLQNNTGIDGDTGVSFNGTDDVRIFEINTNGQRWISATITDYVTGTIKLSAISLQK